MIVTGATGADAILQWSECGGVRERKLRSERKLLTR
jgi:hypothetical protein